ncbi:MAG: hypothetical protein IJD57_03415, partial [Candidatus Gastranaerophilales bacterium]|nr:hypothetical protein [Candidatus Gastranaerophilales bacterium]
FFRQAPMKEKENRTKRKRNIGLVILLHSRDALSSIFVLSGTRGFATQTTLSHKHFTKCVCFLI